MDERRGVTVGSEADASVRRHKGGGRGSCATENSKALLTHRDDDVPCVLLSDRRIRAIQRIQSGPVGVPMDEEPANARRNVAGAGGP